MRPSSWPNHCWPAIRSAPLASNMVQPLLRESSREKPKHGAFADELFAADQQRPGHRPLQCGLRRAQLRVPFLRVDQNLGIVIRPEAAEGCQKALIDLAALDIVESTDERRGKWVAHPLEEATDACKRRGRRQIQRRTERRLVSHCGPVVEIFAKDLCQHGVVAPPILGPNYWRTN